MVKPNLWISHIDFESCRCKKIEKFSSFTMKCFIVLKNFSFIIIKKKLYQLKIFFK